MFGYEALKKGDAKEIVQNAVSQHFLPKQRELAEQRLLHAFNAEQLEKAMLQLQRGEIPWDEKYEKAADGYYGIWTDNKKHIVDWITRPDLKPYTTTLDHPETVEYNFKHTVK